LTYINIYYVYETKFLMLGKQIKCQNYIVHNLNVITYINKCNTEVSTHKFHIQLFLEAYSTNNIYIASNIFTLLKE